jgi:hypothetical protein
MIHECASKNESEGGSDTGNAKKKSLYEIQQITIWERHEAR